MAAAAANAVILWILVKLTSDVTVGQFTLAYAVTTPLFLLTDLSLRYVQGTDARREFEFVDYFGLRLLTVAISLVLLVDFVVLRGYEPEKTWLILFVGLAKALESVSDVIFGLLQQRERMDRIAKSMVWKGVASVVLVAGMLLFGQQILWAVASMALVRLIVLLAYDLPNAAWSQRDRGIRPRWHGPTLRRLARLSWPLGLATVLVSLNFAIPRVVIESYYGDAELGLFGPLAYILVLGQIVVTALGAAASPKLSQYYARGDDRAFVRLLAKLSGAALLLGAVLLCVSLAAGEPILRIVFEDQHAENVDVLNWLLLAGAIGYVGSLLGFGVTATREFRRLTLPYSLITAVAIVGSLWLIPGYASLGAAWATVAISVANCAVPLYVLGTLLAGRRGAVSGGLTEGIGVELDADLPSHASKSDWV
jgi:O-antigen/teichoic acid export membrane protein